MKKQNINIGDKLLCKKDFSDLSYRFLKGRYYLVWNIINDIVYDNEDYIYQIEAEQEISYDFYFEKILYDHFYSNSELRKIKLEKLEKNLCK